MGSPQLEKVNYELWTSSEDHNGAEFKGISGVALDLIEDELSSSTLFMMVMRKAARALASRAVTKILGDKYCAPDPDGQLNEKLSGADVVKENLRQMCVWLLLTDEVIANGGKNNEPLIKWWCYATSS